MKRLGDAFLVAARVRDVRDGEADEEEQDDDSELIASEPIASEPIVSSATRRGVAASRRAWRRAIQARRAYARAAALAPNDAAARGDVAAACAAEAEALLELGDAVGARRAVVTAERCLRAGLRLHPADPALWTALGTLPRVVVDEDADADADAERDARRRDRARRETALARAAALAPSRAPAWAALGRLYLEAAAEEKDVGDGEKDARGDGDGEYGEYGERAERAEFLLRRAERAFDHARSADPSSAEAWIGTATLRAMRGDAAEAAGAWRLAADNNGGAEADARRALAGLRLRLGETRTGTGATGSVGAAYASARRATEASPLDATAAMAAGLTAEARGLVDEARRRVRDAAELARRRGDADVERAAHESLRRGGGGDGGGEHAASYDEGESSEAKVDSSASDSSASSYTSLTRRLARRIHASPLDLASRGDLARVLRGASSSSVDAEAACRVAPRPRLADVASPPGTTPASASARVEAFTRAANARAAAVLAAVPGGTGDDAVAALTRIARELAAATAAAPFADATKTTRALAAVVLARRAVAARDGSVGPRAERACAVLAAAGDGSDPHPGCGGDAHLAAATLAAATESALSRGDVDAARRYAAAGTDAARRCAVGRGAAARRSAATADVARERWAAGDAVGARESAAKAKAEATEGTKTGTTAEGTGTVGARRHSPLLRPSTRSPRSPPPRHSPRR